MNKRGTGTVFCIIAAFLYVSRYIVAAIFLSGVTSWYGDLFQAGLEYVGSSLQTLSIISFAVGIIYLIWAEVEENRGKGTSSENTERCLSTAHVEKAEELFADKFHCSQAVLGAFAEEFGIEEEKALKLGGCFGGGMCKGEVCGACTGALMVLGLKYGQSEVDDLESRAKTNAVTEQFLDKFKRENGSYMCKELLGCDLATEEGREEARKKNLFIDFCPKMVVSAVEIVEEMIHDDKEW